MHSANDMLKINTNIHPKNGYFFVEKDGATIRSDSWGGVIARVQEYRVRNGYAPGDPEAEVTAQVCKRSPGYCHNEDEKYLEQLNTTNMKGKILRWFAHIRSKGLTFVAEQHAKNRMQVCASCPMNKSLPEGCSSCRAAVEELRNSVLGGRARDSRLKGCSAAGVDINTAVWLDEGIDQNKALVEHCWRKYRP